MYSRLKGTEIYHEITGDGPPLLMLHGWGANLRLFDQLKDALAPYYTVHAIDFPGFGKSPEPPAPWSVYDYADLVTAYIKENKLSRVSLMGHSFGGRLSLILGDQMDIDQILLLGAAGIVPRRPLSYYIKVYGYKTMKVIEKVPGMRLLFGDLFDAYRHHAGSADYKAASPLMRRSLSLVVNQDLQHHMPNIQAETLIVYGVNDHDTPVSYGHIMEEKIPKGTLIVLENAGHYTWLDQPAQVAGIAKAFFKEVKDV